MPTCIRQCNLLRESWLKFCFHTIFDPWIQKKITKISSKFTWKIFKIHSNIQISISPTITYMFFTLAEGRPQSNTSMAVQYFMLNLLITIHNFEVDPTPILWAQLQMIHIIVYCANLSSRDNFLSLYLFIYLYSISKY